MSSSFELVFIHPLSERRGSALATTAYFQPSNQSNTPNLSCSTSCIYEYIHDKEFSSRFKTCALDGVLIQPHFLFPNGLVTILENCTYFSPILDKKSFSLMDSIAESHTLSYSKNSSGALSFQTEESPESSNTELHAISPRNTIFSKRTVYQETWGCPR